MPRSSRRWQSSLPKDAAASTTIRGSGTSPAPMRRAGAPPSGFEHYVTDLLAEALEESPRPAGYVPQTTLWWVDDDTYLGRVGIRLSAYAGPDRGRWPYRVRRSAERASPRQRDRDAGSSSPGGTRAWQRPSPPDVRRRQRSIAQGDPVSRRCARGPARREAALWVPTVEPAPVSWRQPFGSSSSAAELMQ